MTANINHNLIEHNNNHQTWLVVLLFWHWPMAMTNPKSNKPIHKFWQQHYYLQEVMKHHWFHRTNTVYKSRHCPTTKIILLEMSKQYVLLIVDWIIWYVETRHTSYLLSNYHILMVKRNVPQILICISITRIFINPQTRTIQGMIIQYICSKWANGTIHRFPST